MAGSIGTAFLTLVPKMDNGAKASMEAELGKSGANSGKGFGASFGGALKSIAGTAVVVGAGAAIADTFSTAFTNAAANQQLVGGVETLFKDSADTIKTYASTAYKDSGLSANQYMEQVTSFSAALINSLEGDTANAADYADLAIRDMSDNANKMGTNIESIQNAYQGFAKQNYTMLDNLKLGYGGTKQEMQRLIDHANELREQQGLNADLTIDSYADVVTAIHEVQTEMDITGTTAKEAGSTVEGSINQLKGAWENFLTGIGSGGDMAQLAQDLIESFGTALENIVPLVIDIFTGMITALPDVVNQLLPIVVDALVMVINNIPTWFPMLLGAAVNLFMGLVQAVPTVAGALFSALQGIMMQLPGIVTSFVGQMASAGGQLIQGIASGLNPGAVIGKIREICASAVDAVKSFFGIHSPSRVMRELFGYVTDGMVLGLADGETDVERGMQSLMDTAYGTASGFGVGLNSALAGAGAAGGVTIVLNGATLNDDQAMRDAAFDFLVELRRKARM